MPTALFEALPVAPALPAADAAVEKAAACGPPETAAWLCSTVYDVTSSQTAAEIADDFAVPLRVVMILLVAYVLVRVARLVVRRVVRRMQRDQTGNRISRIRQRTGLALLDTSPVPNVRRALRAETIGAVLRSIASVLIWATALLMVLDELGVNLAAIGLGAGIAGVAIGFGSQALVRDFLSGIFMLIEDQYGVGDVVDTGEATGTVEGVSLRTTRLRDAEGTVWHVPNGEIRRVGNKSQQWSRVILDVAVAYNADLERASQIIRDVAATMADEPDLGLVIIDEPELWGVEQVEAERVMIRLAVKTLPLEQWRVARALRERLKAALDEAGIAPISPAPITYNVEGGPPDRDS